MPEILSKITRSQIIADNRIGGTSVILITFSGRIPVSLLSSAQQHLFASHKSGKNRKIRRTKKNGRAFYALPSFMWPFPLLLLAFASYARISLCLVCGTESGQYKVKPIMAGWSSATEPLFSISNRYIGRLQFHP
jgi:hypothetical protein